MFRKKMLPMLCLFFPLTASAADIACSGNITWVMAEHPSCVDGNNKKQLAYKIEGSGYWFCSGSDTASSLVLGAKFAAKSVTVYMDNANGASCTSHSHYLKPSYIILP
jgi:hypothetical protein